jgi:uncharacterized damage-inducible protein DinB
MTELPPENLSQPWAGHDRVWPPLIGDERTLLVGYLEWYRRTFELKCEGLSEAQVSERCLPPSGLSLHGLCRHLAAVERWWFQIRSAGRDVPLIYYSDDAPNEDFDDLEGEFAEALSTWRQECETSRAIVAASYLDDLGTTNTRDEISLRNILFSMIGEYARHAGHADLLRERLDGRTGF